MNILKDNGSTQALHHLGFVVADVTAGMKGFVRSLEAMWDGRVYEEPHQRVRVAFLAIKLGDPLIELVEPTTEDSPVWRFLSEQGGGLHHVCYEVGDLEEKMVEMKARRCMIIRRPKPAVAFMAVESPGCSVRKDSSSSYLRRAISRSYAILSASDVYCRPQHGQAASAAGVRLQRRCPIFGTFRHGLEILGPPR